MSHILDEPPPRSFIADPRRLRPSHAELVHRRQLERVRASLLLAPRSHPEA
jgi:hypothetical protein